MKRCYKCLRPVGHPWRGAFCCDRCRGLGPMPAIALLTLTVAGASSWYALCVIGGTR
jgi:hypothetical protein